MIKHMLEPSMEELILNGIVEVSGFDPETQEFLYSFTPKLREAMPGLWNDRMNFIEQEITYLAELGFLEVVDVSDKNSNVRLTDLAFDEEAISRLPEDKKRSLEEIKKMFER